uniref:Uncharacterized protein n=1 Tax=Rangifer tarandus platyrhynchus TaxID=3082113 RepID=A0ACB0EI61_RANTA|nr:unnamed protein product [Rangifer tarandus platyrhynchus]
MYSKHPPILTPQHTLPSPEKKPSQMGGEMLNFPADDLAGSFTPHLWPSVAFHAAAGPSPPGPSTEAAERWRQDPPAAPETEVPPGPRTDSQSCPGGMGAQQRDSPEPPPKTRIFQKGFGGLQNACVPAPALGRPSARRGCGREARSGGTEEPGSAARPEPGAAPRPERTGAAELPAQRPPRAAQPRPQVGEGRPASGRRVRDGRTARPGAQSRRRGPGGLGSGSPSFQPPAPRPALGPEERAGGAAPTVDAHPGHPSGTREGAEGARTRVAKISGSFPRGHRPLASPPPPRPPQAGAKFCWSRRSAPFTPITPGGWRGTRDGMITFGEPCATARCGVSCAEVGLCPSSVPAGSGHQATGEWDISFLSSAA